MQLEVVKLPEAKKGFVMMRHDHHKQCLDDSIVVDTSSAVLPGRRAFAAWPGTTSDCRQPLQAVIFWLS
jgi:hypothetical protein